MFRRLFAVLALASLSACAPSRPPPDLAPTALAFRERILAELDWLELERLYVLEPLRTTETTANFRGFPVLREAEPAAADRRDGRAHRGLRSIMEATTNVAMACFDPGHGATFRGMGQTYDVLVCFGCSNYRIHGREEEGMGDSFEGAAVAPWFHAFAAAGLGKNAGRPSP